ncbi:MAG: hypothetical protein HFI93_05205 [Lachnospiraceae bacterium]|nr:hypothetical protein [Lachnospiraceae bacterium]
MESKEVKLIHETLFRLGANSSYLGFSYVTSCTVMVLENEEFLCQIKVPYIDTAAEYRTTSKCVERNIRTLLTTIWSNGNRDLLTEIAGAPLHRRPKNKAFIGMLADYVKKAECPPDAPQKTE